MTGRQGSVLRVCGSGLIGFRVGFIRVTLGSGLARFKVHKVQSLWLRMDQVQDVGAWQSAGLGFRVPHAQRSEHVADRFRVLWLKVWGLVSHP